VRRTHLATQLSNITIATTGQKTIGSEMKSDLLMMGVKTPETSSSSQRTHLATRLSGVTAATTGQKTIGSVTQSDLMMGVKTPETC
jgi:hypothetical protein